MTVVRISDDALALASGADAVAHAFEQTGCTVQRVSSWGMHWLEPLVEIDGQGFGPLDPEDVAGVLDGTSAKAIGAIADHPFIARQQRLTFARAGRTRPPFRFHGAPSPSLIPYLCTSASTLAPPR